MKRPSEERLRAALIRATSPSGAISEGDAGVLAAEVLALREDKERLIRGAPAIENAEIAHLKATIARIEALPTKWQAETDGLWVESDEYVFKRDCADQVRGALKGGAS